MKPTPRTVTRIAFGVIIVFVLVQVIWWIIFQNRYIATVTNQMLGEWRNDVAFANLLFSENPSEALKTELLQRYPHLMFDANEAGFSLNQDLVKSFAAEQNSSSRMFAYEGPFFVIVVLIGLWIIARSLRTERELKTRQQNFLSAITHEFKTPISTLRLLIQTALMRNLAPEKQRDYLERMEAELSRLEQTSEQVLASARLEQSSEATVLEPLELNSLVQGLVGKVRSGLEARGAELKVVYNPEPLPVSVDSSAMSVVLNNLLDNAVKYSPSAPKLVTVRLLAQDDLAIVQVEDQGMGVSEQEMKHIFDRFYRVGSEMTRNSKGVGLGLHLVKSITEAMNGWVRVEANDPQGTRFSIVLPRRVTLTNEETLKAQLGGAT